jgi:hypothetical protein
MQSNDVKCIGGERRVKIDLLLSFDAKLQPSPSTPPRTRPPRSKLLSANLEATLLEFSSSTSTPVAASVMTKSLPDMLNIFTVVLHVHCSGCLHGGLPPIQPTYLVLCLLLRCAKPNPPPPWTPHVIEVLRCDRNTS